MISGGLHSFLLALFLGLILARTSPKERIEISVIEAPAHAPKTVALRSMPKPEEKTKPKPRAVSGLSRKALIDTSSAPGIETKTGNTLAKAPDQEKLRPEDADSLPIPTDEFLVTQMPEISQEYRVPYPPEARKKGIQGAVVMDLLIDAIGRVREATLVQGPEESLSQAALGAIKNFQFKPARIQDRPVAVRIRYAYRFVLER